MSSSNSRGGHSTSTVSLASRGGRSGQRQKHSNSEAQTGAFDDVQPFSLFSVSPWVLTPGSSNEESLNVVGNALDNPLASAPTDFFGEDSETDRIHIELLGRPSDEDSDGNANSSSADASGTLRGHFNSNDSFITLTEMSVNNDRNKCSDEMYWIVEELRNDVKKMNTKLEQLIKESKENRMHERISTLEGRQRSIQSKMSILDSCFGSNSGLWNKCLKPLKALLESAKQSNQQQHSSTIATSKSTPGKFKETIPSTSPSPSPLESAQSSDISSYEDRSTPVGVTDTKLSEGTESRISPDVISNEDDPIRNNFVSYTELSERLGKLSHSINVKMKQMSENVTNIQRQMNENIQQIRENMGNLEGKISGFRSDLKYAVNERKGQAKSHQLSLKRVGKYSYKLEASSNINEMLMKANADNRLSSEVLRKLSEKLVLQQAALENDDSTLDLKEVGEHLYILSAAASSSKTTLAAAAASPYVGIQSPYSQTNDAYKDHMSPYQSYYQRMNYHGYPSQAYVLPHANVGMPHNPYSKHDEYNDPYFLQCQRRIPDRHKKQWPSEGSITEK